MSPTYGLVQVVDDEPQVDIQLDRRGVVGVAVEHPDGEAAAVQIVQAGQDQLAAKPGPAFLSVAGRRR